LRQVLLPRSDSVSGSETVVQFWWGVCGKQALDWSDTHNRDHPIIEDEAGLANLLRHIKGRNCLILGLKNMAEAAAYADMMAKEGQVIIDNCLLPILFLC